MNRISTLARATFIALLLLPALSPAQTSTWIAPVGNSPRSWTDSANWDSGVPNSATATATFARTTTETGELAVISGADVSVDTILFGDGTDIPPVGQHYPSVQIGGFDGSRQGDLQRATLTVNGAGVFSGSANATFGLRVPNGTIQFRNSAIFKSALVASAENSYLGAPAIVVFSDTAVDRGRIMVGNGGRGGGRLEFRDHSVLDGGIIELGSAFSSATVTFLNQATVREGAVTVDGYSSGSVRIQDRANTAGLTIFAGGRTNLDVIGATGIVTVKAISGIVDLVAGTNSLRISDNLTLAPASSLTLTAATGGNVTVGGQASLAGTLRLGTLPREAAVGTHRYPLLMANGVSGRFGTVVGLPGSTAMLKTGLDYTATDVAVLLQQQSFNGVAGNTPAAAALGAHLDATLAIAVGDYRDLLASLNALATADHVRAALDALSPDRYAVVPELAFAATAARLAMLERAITTGRGAFFTAWHARTRRDASEAFPRTATSRDGGMAGSAWQHGAWSLQAFIAHEQGTTDLDTNGSQVSEHSTTPGIQGRWRAGALHIGGTIAFTRHEYDFRRHVSYTGSDRVAMATATARQVDWALDCVRDFRGPLWQLTTSAGFVHSEWWADDFAETAAGATALQFSGWRNRSLRSRVGFDFATASADRKWWPRFAAHWLHEFKRSRPIPARFTASTADYYLAPGRPADVDELQTALGLCWQAGEHLAVSIDGDLATNGRHSTTGLSIGCRWQF